MIQTQQHVFSHQHQYQQAEPSWMNQQPHHQQQQHHAAQQHAQAQAAAAAAAAAQQQHYNRIAVNNNTTNSANVSQDLTQSNASMEGGISDENRKVLQWVAELMDPGRREAALMELSKKREQVPELALIIWHSYGMCL